MNGHERRKQQKIESIKRAAVELYNKYGIKKVAMDEIAAAADVSKVTIYKYFRSKEDLTKDIIKSELNDSISSARGIIEGEKNFLEKMRYIVSTKKRSSSLLEGKYATGIIAGDPELRDFISTQFQTMITELMFSFFDQGKKEGYIDKKIANEALYLFVETFKAGLAARPDLLQKITSNQEFSDQFIDLYFFGFINRDRKEQEE